MYPAAARARHEGDGRAFTNCAMINVRLQTHAPPLKGLSLGCLTRSIRPAVATGLKCSRCALIIELPATSRQRAAQAHGTARLCHSRPPIGSTSGSSPSARRCHQRPSGSGERHHITASPPRAAQQHAARPRAHARWRTRVHARFRTQPHRTAAAVGAASMAAPRACTSMSAVICSKRTMCFASVDR